MFIVTVHHNCKPGRTDQAIERIDRNGRQMAEVEGFLYRYRTRHKDNSQMICTITGWESEDAYERWLAVKKGLPEESGESPYISATNERHLVEDYLPAAC